MTRLATIARCFTPRSARMSNVTEKGSLADSGPIYGSITTLAEIVHDNVLIAGAASDHDSLESYSARGPLPGNTSEKKPDIVGATCGDTKLNSLSHKHTNGLAETGVAANSLAMGVKEYWPTRTTG